jgi:hypothetical protein
VGQNRHRVHGVVDQRLFARLRLLPEQVLMRRVQVFQLVWQSLEKFDRPKSQELRSHDPEYQSST